MAIAKMSCPECGANQSLQVAENGHEVELYWWCENCGYAMSAEPHPPNECSDCGSEDIVEEPIGDSNEAHWVCANCGATSDFTHWEVLEVTPSPGLEMTTKAQPSFPGSNERGAANEN